MERVLLKSPAIHQNSFYGLAPFLFWFSIAKTAVSKRHSPREFLPGANGACEWKALGGTYGQVSGAVEGAQAGPLINVPVLPLPLESTAVVPVPASNFQ